MSQGVGVAGIYVRDQDEALDFYVNKLGFQKHTDAKNGDYRWLTVQYPDQPSLQLGLFRPETPTIDEETVAAIDGIIARGAMPPLVLIVTDCHASCEAFRAAGVEITQDATERYGSVDASFRDPSGNGWKLVQAR